MTAWILEQHPEQVHAAVEAQPVLVSVSFGAYRPWLTRLGETGIRTATQVGDLSEATAAVDAGADLIVARGAEGGGHGLDRVATLPLLQQVLDAVPDAPVLAAGGVATGPGLTAVLAAGAVGAWIGTRCLACPEADSSPAARARVVAAGSEDTVYSRVFDIAARLAWPRQYGGRALRNAFLERWLGREIELAADETARQQLAAARQVDEFGTAYIYAGQAIGSITREQSATALTAQLGRDAFELLARWFESKSDKTDHVAMHKGQPYRAAGQRHRNHVHWSCEARSMRSGCGNAACLSSHAVAREGPVRIGAAGELGRSDIGPARSRSSYGPCRRNEAR